MTELEKLKTDMDTKRAARDAAYDAHTAALDARDAARAALDATLDAARAARDALDAALDAARAARDAYDAAARDAYYNALAAQEKEPTDD